ncbi:MAG TPA: DUF992 domain-containing protein [Pseudolabrys sp.]|jgi:hypothetical protein|nr:DUF992 domain-containing protein [Pseudolabrys sp.]
MRKTLMAFAGLALAALAATPADARVRAGMLTCTVSPGVGLVLGSQKQVNCDFRSVQGWHESYSGRITRIGLDIGFTEGGTIAWAVYAPAEGGRGALAGGYGGATAEATIGGGLGANVLVGGFQRSIALQPVSVGAQRGLNAAAGIGGLELYAR